MRVDGAVRPPKRTALAYAADTRFHLGAALRSARHARDSATTSNGRELAGDIEEGILRLRRKAKLLERETVR